MSEIRKYRPSNGTEGDIFMGQFCRQCTKNFKCDIQIKTMAYDVEDNEYPVEWQRSSEGIKIYAGMKDSENVLCTAFEVDNDILDG